jgi:hypothetical protein
LENHAYLQGKIETHAWPQISSRQSERNILLALSSGKLSLIFRYNEVIESVAVQLRGSIDRGTALPRLCEKPIHPHKPNSRRIT